MYLLLSLLAFADPVAPKLIAPAKGAAKAASRGTWTPGDVILTAVGCILLAVFLIALVVALIRRWNRGGNLIAPPMVQEVAQEAVMPTPRRGSLMTPMDSAIAADLDRDRFNDHMEENRREWAKRRGLFRVDDAGAAEAK